jgi:hypothetical protein
MIFFFFLLFHKLVFAQINFTYYFNYPYYFDPQTLFFDATLSKNGNEIFLSLERPVITRTNVTDPYNVTKLGEYRWNGDFNISQINPFYSFHIYKDYLIGCSLGFNVCKIWNVTTFTPIGRFDKVGYFS